MIRCGVCGRPLKNETSVRRGIGPVCYKKYFQEMSEGERQDHVQKKRIEARRNYNKNIRKNPLQEGEIRCKNCGMPVIYHEDDGCPDAFCCTPCCPYAAVKPCPREKKLGSVIDNLSSGKVAMEVP